MDIQTLKIDILQKLMGVSKKSLLDKINNILDNEMVVGYSTDGTPLTKELYNNRLREAEAQIKSGKYISQQELESEYEKGIA